MRGLKHYNVIKDGALVMEDVTVIDIMAKIDVSIPNIRESTCEEKTVKGYLFVEARDAYKTHGQIPRAILDDWDRVTRGFRKLQHTN